MPLRAIPDGTFEEATGFHPHRRRWKVFVYRTADGGFVHDPTISALNVDPTPPEWKSGKPEKMSCLRAHRSYHV